MVERRRRTLDLKVVFKNCYPTRIFSLFMRMYWRKLRSASLAVSALLTFLHPRRASMYDGKMTFSSYLAINE